MQQEKNPSLGSIHESVDISTEKVKQFSFRRIFLFFGPAYLVSVGYMDPGNWATDLAAGSEFGYRLIWVLFISNIIAILMQNLSSRLGVVARRDLIQLSSMTYPRWSNWISYIIAELGIIATDLAEVLGIIIGLNLVFGLSFGYGVMITILDAILLIFLDRLGVRKLEAFIVGLVFVIGVSFVIELFLASPDFSEVLMGFIPSLPNDTALYIAMGIVGATVMPHNIYLHSALVQTRKIDRKVGGLKKAIFWNTFDNFFALNLAFIVNASILILAGSLFYQQYAVSGIEEAYHLLQDVFNHRLGAILFGVALIAAGQSSTVTGVLSGQIVMEGYLHIHMSLWVRRIVSRLFAVIPVFVWIVIFGEQGISQMLVLSQVVLSVQLGFVLIPLLHFTSTKKLMGQFKATIIEKTLGWIFSGLLIILSYKLLLDTLLPTFESITSEVLFLLFLGLMGGFVIFLVLYPIIKPQVIPENFENFEKGWIHEPHHRPLLLNKDFVFPQRLEKIGIVLDFEAHDSHLLQEALKIGGKQANYFILHLARGMGSRVYGLESDDLETRLDQEHLDEYVRELDRYHIQVEKSILIVQKNYAYTLKSLEKEGMHVLVLSRKLYEIQQFWNLSLRRKSPFNCHFYIVDEKIKE